MKALAISGVGISPKELTYRLPPVKQLGLPGGESGKENLSVHAVMSAVEADWDQIVVGTAQTNEVGGPEIRGAMSIVDRVLERSQSTRVRRLEFDAGPDRWERSARGLFGDVMSTSQELCGEHCLDYYDAIVMEVGAGLRHVALGLFLAAVHLRVLARQRRQAQKVVVLYGMVSGPTGPLLMMPGGFKPKVPLADMGWGPSTDDLPTPTAGVVLDLGSYFDQLQATSAVEALVQGGDFRGARALLGGAGGALQDFLTRAQAGLVPDAALAARAVRDQGGASAVGPVMAMARAPVLKAARVWAASGDGKSKEEMLLNEEQIGAQRGVAEWLLERGQLVEATLLAREWLVNRMLRALGGAEVPRGGAWLGRAGRVAAERCLHATGFLAFRASGDDEHSIKDLSRAWGKVAARRNPFAHMGFTDRKTGVSPEGVNAALSVEDSAFDAAATWCTPEPGAAAILLATDSLDIARRISGAFGEPDKRVGVLWPAEVLPSGWTSRGDDPPTGVDPGDDRRVAAAIGPFGALPIWLRRGTSKMQDRGPRFRLLDALVGRPERVTIVTPSCAGLAWVTSALEGPLQTAGATVEVVRYDGEQIVARDET